jgi:hypothetical protein
LAQRNGIQRTPRKAVRGTRFTRLADAAAPGLRHAATRRGMAEHALIRDWSAVVGAETATLCRPVRISHRGRGEELGGTLVVAAPGPLVPEVTHLADRIAERVNRVYGYRAIARVRVQADLGIEPAVLAEREPAWRHDAPPAMPPVSPEVASIGDEDLRAALARLEANIRRRPRRPASDA